MSQTFGRHQRRKDYALRRNENNGRGNYPIDAVHPTRGTAIPKIKRAVATMIVQSIMSGGHFSMKDMKESLKNV